MAGRDQPAPVSSPQRGGGEVLPDRQRREDRLLAPVPGHVGGARGPQRPQVVVLALALEPGQADDLARPQVEAARGQHDVAERGRVGGLGRLLDQVLAAGHQLDQPADLRLVAVQGGDRLTRAEHRDPVGDLGHLVHPVRDEQHRAARAGQGADGGEQPVAGGHVEGRGRLVEDQHLGLAQQRPADRDRLPLAQRERAGRRGQVRAAAEQLGQHRPRPARAGRPPRGRAEDPVGAEPEVVEHRLARHALHFLEHGRHPGRDRRPGAARPQRHRLDADQAAVRSVHPGEDLDQGGLARPVLAHEGVDRARRQLERAVAERDGRAEGLRHPLDRQQGGRRGLCLRHRRCHGLSRAASRRPRPARTPAAR